MASSSSSSLGIACGGSSRLAASFGIQKRCRFAGALHPCSVVIGDQVHSAAWKGRISVAAAEAPAAVKTVENRMSLESLGNDKRDGGGAKSDAVEARARLDRWMRESVVDIVKNLRDAPLLVQVFSNRKGETTSSSSSTSTKATDKKVVVEDWTGVKERWESGETPMPDGVIFMEELSGDESENGGERKERTTKVWGIVVQGKGVGCGPVCYLLKTSRVGSGPGPGMGLFATHFCLMRVKSFEESVHSQLKNCWLLQNQYQ